MKLQTNQNKLPNQANTKSAMNFFFIIFLAGGILYAAYTNKMQEVVSESTESAKAAVSLAINLIGVMSFWLGLIKVLEVGGLMHSFAKKLEPIMSKLFPDIPTNHPAIGAVTLSISANFLGLGNAATPLGIKAMEELNKLNPFKGTNSDAMCLFLVITASSITLLPLGTINIRAAAGCSAPASIFLPTLFATCCSTFFGVITAIFFAKRDLIYLRQYKEHTEKNEIISINEHCAQILKNTATDTANDLKIKVTYSAKLAGFTILAVFFVLLVKQLTYATLQHNLLHFLIDELFSSWLMPSIILLVVVYGLISGVKLYEAVTEGAKQGFDTAVRIIPYLVSILVAVSIFRGSGAMDLLCYLLDPISSIIGLPAAVLPMAIVRPLSGSGAFAIMSDIIKHSPDSYEATVASTIMGCTETSFYILAVYCGAVGVSKVRHALIASLVADTAGVIAACMACRVVFLN